MRNRRKGRRVRNENGELVRVLFAGFHTCIRVIKQTRSLKGLGYTVDGLTHTISYGTQEFNNLYFFHNKYQFMNVMRDVGHLYDIVVWHNEPNKQLLWFHRVREEEGFKHKLICDWHDLNSVRLGNADKEEIKVFRLADGFVFVSPPCYEHSKDLYNFKQPSTIFEHFCNKEWKGYKTYKPGKEDLEKRHGIVYEGGLNQPDHALPPEHRAMFRYRTMYYLFKDAVADGNELFVFAGNPDGYQTHLEIGATIFPPTDYDEMMTKMHEYKWGWCLFGESGNPQTELTQANKFYEYIKAGCVPICCWCKETERLCKELGCGIVLEDPSELGNIDKNFGHLYPELKARVDEINTTGELDSENHIYRIENLWREVLNGNDKS